MTTFEEWMQTHDGDPWPYIRHACSVEVEGTRSDWEWRIVYRSMAYRVADWVFRLTASQRLQWNPDSLKPLFQMQDFGYQAGVGLKVDVARRPAIADEYAPFLLYLQQVCEQDKDESLRRERALKRTCDEAMQKLQSLGWMNCIACGFVQTPHDPCPEAACDGMAG